MKNIKMSALKKTKSDIAEKEDSIKSNNYFEQSILLFFFFLVAFITVLFMEKGTDDYYHGQSALLVLSLMVICLYFILKHNLIEMIRHLFHVEKWDKKSYSELFMLFTYILTIISLITIDLSFFENYGITIGAVVAVNLVVVLRALWLIRIKPKL